MDAYRDGDRFDIPGVNPDSIELTVEKNVLTVRAERAWQPADGQEAMVAERPQGVFTRQPIALEDWRSRVSRIFACNR